MDTHLRERVVEVLPRIREEAARTEAERRIPTEVLAALMEAGAFTLDPDQDPTARAAQLLDTVRLVAAACGSTGWVTAHAGAMSWVLDLFPAETREKLRGTPGADPLLAFSPELAGRLVEADGQLLLEGRWAAVTGAGYASFLVLACRRPDAGEPGPAGLALVRAEDCRFEDAVDSVGLTASGATDVVVTGAPVADVWTEISVDRAATLAPLGAAAAMALVGAAQGALDVHLAQIRHRVERSHGGEDVTARDLSPARVARAASQLDAADLVLREQLAAEPDPEAVGRDPFEEQLYAVDRAVESAGLVFASVRGHALDNNDPVARFWRDVRVGGHHARALIGRLRVLGA